MVMLLNWWWRLVCVYHLVVISPSVRLSEGRSTFGHTTCCRCWCYRCRLPSSTEENVSVVNGDVDDPPTLSAGVRIRIGVSLGFSVGSRVSIAQSLAADEEEEDWQEVENLQLDV